MLWKRGKEGENSRCWSYHDHCAKQDALESPSPLPVAVAVVVELIVVVVVALGGVGWRCCS
jgi:hypothetical protein